MKRSRIMAGALVVLALSAACGNGPEANDDRAGAAAPAASAAAVPRVDGGVCTGAEAKDDYLGLSRAAADSKAATAGWSEVRRFGVPETQGQAAGTDSDPTRLTLVFDENLTVSAACAG